MRSLKSLRKDEAGSATVEFVLWVPLFAFLLMLTVNASFVFMDLTRMQNAARDGARRMAVGDFQPTTVGSAVLSQLPVADYAVNAGCSTKDYACVSVSRPTNSMLPFGNFMGVGNLLGKTFGATVKVKFEPGIYESLTTGS